MKVFILTRKRMAALGAALAVILCFGILGAKRSELAVAVNAQACSIPIYCVSTEEKKVSLSFDAAWGDEYTQPLLDILAKYNVKTTFFLVGDWVRSYPDDVKKIAAAGHDVGNHSNTHPYMTKIDSDAVKNEIDTCSTEIEKLTGVRPTLFRPPYGDYNNSVVDTVKSMNMYCVQWSIDSLDWQDPSPEEILQKVQKNLAPGAIILMHNGAKNTPAALPSVIEYIQSQGYEIVPISQLLPKGSYTTDANGAMIPSKDSAVKTAADVSSRTQSQKPEPTYTNTQTASDNTSSQTVSAKQSSDTMSSQISSDSKKNAMSKKEVMNSDTSPYSGLAGEMYNMNSKNKAKKN